MSSPVAAVSLVQQEGSQLSPRASSRGQTSQQISGDTVTLSQPAHVSQLSSLGESASTIAADLGVSVSLIDLDLGIVAQPASLPLVAQTAHVAAPVAASSAAEISKSAKS